MEIETPFRLVCAGVVSSVWMSKSRKILSVACKTKKTGNWHASRARGVQPVMVLGQLH